MTREEAEKEIRYVFTEVWSDGIIKALEQEPREDEVILTREEYGELLRIIDKYKAEREDK